VTSKQERRAKQTRRAAESRMRAFEAFKCRERIQEGEVF
jgi:hypothetical protein